MLRKYPVAGTLLLAALGWAGATSLIVATVPELGERGGEDTIFKAPSLSGAGRAALVIAAVIVFGFVIRQFLTADEISTPRHAREVVLVSVATGVLSGLGFRLVTARTDGANIGGGLVLLAAPFAALAFAIYLVTRVRAISGTPRDQRSTR